MTTMSTATTTTPIAVLSESETLMTDDLFQQFCLSLTSTDIVDEWLKDPFEGSVQSSPEIATPIEPFLSHPIKDKEVGLDSPLFGAISPCPSATLSPEQLSNLFIDLQSLTGTLPTFTHSEPVSPPMTATPLMSPMATTTSTFAVSPKRIRTGDALDPVDDAALKRQKNTDAARRSRMRKVMKMETLENKVADLEAMNTKFLLRVAVLEAEKTGLQSKEESQESRIRALEAQLAEAHHALARHTK